MLSFGANRVHLEGDAGARHHQRDPPGVAGHVRDAALASSGLVETNGMARPGPDLLPRARRGVLEFAPGGTYERGDRTRALHRIETVRTHARNIYRKLGISSRRDLASLSRTKLHA